jgi:ABC-type multidrug transport system fused ATPase/permease subunit
MASSKSLSWSGVWSEARVLVWAHRGRLSIGFVLMLINRVLGLVLPTTSKFFIDDVVGKHRVELLPLLALASAAATVFQAISSFALSQILSVAAQRATADMRVQVNEHVLRLPIGYFDSTQTGQLISRVMNDPDGLRNLIGTGLVQFTGGIVQATLAVGVLIWLNWHLTAGILVVLALFGVGMAYTFSVLRPLFRVRAQIQAEVTGRLNQSLNGVRVVKAYVAEDRESEVFSAGVLRLFENIRKTITGMSAAGAGAAVIVGSIGVIMLQVGGRAIVSGHMTLGELMMYLFFTGMTAAPLIQLASIGTQFSEAFAGLDRIHELRSMATEDQQDERRRPMQKLEGEVRFEQVSFAYTPDVPVLRDVSFHAPAGSTTALVGSSGSGKSTLISLIMTFNRPGAGRVLVDGQDLSTVRLRDYRGHLGIVLQDNFLFDGTVAENIAYARPDATPAEIVAVAKLAYCDEFVMAFPNQYDTVVGERGVRLSGGERQRVAIARALLADPRILILDEATSSLDSESEAMIQEGLKRLRAGRTTFVIAHRLSTIQSADQILVLEEGQIVERGSHAGLLALNGRYRQLYDKQYRFERDRFVNPGEDFTTEPPATETSKTSPPRLDPRAL